MLHPPSAFLPPFRAMSSVSPMMYSFASNTSLFVLRSVFYVLLFICPQAMLSPVLLMPKRDPSIEKDCSTGLSVWRLAFLAVSSLSPANETMVPENISDFTHSVHSEPEVTLIFVPVVSALAGHCPMSFGLALFGFINASLYSGCSSDPACYSLSCRVTGRMFLAD